MVELDYLIMYSMEGIPIYSYKFNSIFEISDDFLLSAFLTSLNQYAMSENAEERPQTLKLDDQEIKINYSNELKLSTIEIQNTMLIFYHGESPNLTIGAGINKEHYSAISTLFAVTQMMVEIDQFMMLYTDFDWRDVEITTLDEFERELHLEVIHKFMETHTSDDPCYLDDTCPYKLFEAEYKSNRSWAERIKSKFRRN